MFKIQGLEEPVKVFNHAKSLIMIKGKEGVITGVWRSKIGYRLRWRKNLDVDGGVTLFNPSTQNLHGFVSQFKDDLLDSHLNSCNGAITTLFCLRLSLSLSLNFVPYVSLCLLFHVLSPILGFGCFSGFGFKFGCLWVAGDQWWLWG